MRTARPKMLYSGKWGAWVTGGDVRPDMLMRIRTRNGKSWFSKVKRVLWQGASGAICERERIDLSMEDDLNLEIPFLDQFKPNNESDQLLLGQLRNWVYYQVEDVNGPAPEIEQHEYYEDFVWNRDFYESCAQSTIEELDRELEAWLRAKSNPWAEATPNSPKTSVSDRDIQIDFREEQIRRQRGRMPRQIANLSDYSRLAGPDSAWN